MKQLSKRASNKLTQKTDKYKNVYFEMHINDDAFVHFSKKERIPEIIKSGKLLQRPPYKKFGTDTTDAVSVIYGKLMPGVQTTHISKNVDDLAAIYFTTNKKPKVGYIEEVKWETDVPFSSVRAISYSEAISMLSHTPEQLEDDRYYVLYI